MALRVSSVPGGYQTTLDIDFSAQSSQTLSSNTTYTIGGLTWTRQNIANYPAAGNGGGIAVTNGSGVVITPQATTDYGTAVRTAPILHLPFSQLSIPNLTWSTRIRVSAFMSADNIAANGDTGELIIESLPALGAVSTRYALASRGYSGGGYLGYNDSSPSPTIKAMTLDATNRALYLEMQLGMIGASNNVQYASALQATPTPAVYKLNAIAAPSVALSTMGVTLNALRAASATALSITWSRLIVEYAN